MITRYFHVYCLTRSSKYCCCSIVKSCMTLSEKAMATHSSTLAWKIPRTEEPGRLQSMESLGVGQTTEWLHFHFSLSCIGEGNGNPLQCSRLENPRDGGAWWGAVCGVAQNQTRLKWLSSSSSSLLNILHLSLGGAEGICSQTGQQRWPRYEMCLIAGCAGRCLYWCRVESRSTG